MARGWESKSVEAQQDEAIAQSGGSRASRLSAAEAVLVREKENLRLARQRVLQQLAASSDERHRKLLQASLAAIDEKIEKLPQPKV